MKLIKFGVLGEITKAEVELLKLFLKERGRELRFNAHSLGVVMYGRPVGGRDYVTLKKAIDSLSTKTICIHWSNGGTKSKEIRPLIDRVERVSFTYDQSGYRITEYRVTIAPMIMDELARKLTGGRAQNKGANH